MDMNEQAKIIALARLCGSTLPENEILAKYTDLFQTALKSLSTDATPAKVEVFKRPF